MQKSDFDSLRRVLEQRADGLSDSNLRRAMERSVYKSDEWCFYCLLLAQRLLSRGDVDSSKNLLRKIESHEFPPSESVNMHLLKSGIAEAEGDDVRGRAHLMQARQADRTNASSGSQFKFSSSIAASFCKSGELEAALQEWREFIDYAKGAALPEHQIMLAHKSMARMLADNGDLITAKEIKKSWFDEQVKNELLHRPNLQKLPEPPESFNDHLVDFFTQARCNALGFYERHPALVAELLDLQAQFIVARRSMRSEMAELLDANNARHLTDEQKLPYFFFMRCASAYLSSVELAIGGRTPEAYGVMRSCIENSLYAFHLHQKPSDAGVWLNRPKLALGEKNPSKKKARMAIGTTFSPGQIIADLEAVSVDIAEQLRYFLELSIDEGAHPNVDVFKQHASESNADEGYTFSVSFLNPSLSELCVDRILKSTRAVLDAFRLIHTDWIW